MKNNNDNFILSPLLDPLYLNIIEFKNIIEFAALLYGKKVVRLVVNNKTEKYLTDLINLHYKNLSYELVLLS